MYVGKRTLVCNGDAWKCNDTLKCIPYTKLCDGTPDCQDRSDEICDTVPENLNKNPKLKGKERAKVQTFLHGSSRLCFSEHALLQVC